MTEFFQHQQEQFEAGLADWLQDPYAVARAFMDAYGWHDEITAIRPVSDAIPYFSNDAPVLSDDPPARSDDPPAPPENPFEPAHHPLHGEPLHIRHGGLLAGAIAIDGTILYLDQVEVIFRDDHARVEEFRLDEEAFAHTLYVILHLNSDIIAPNDYARIAEFGLDPATAFPYGDPYVMLRDIPPLRLQITPSTVFEFVDSDLALPDTDPEGNRFRMVDLPTFLQARPHLANPSLAGSTTFRRVAMFVELCQVGHVARVTEEFLLTQ